MLLEEFIIWFYCCVDFHVSKLHKEQPWRSRGFTPQLTDAEIITMELVGEFLGQDTDKGIWQYFKNHWSHYFPNLESRSNFAKHASNLWHVKQKIQEKIIEEIGALEEKLHIIDGFPMPLCHFRRAKRSKVFSDIEDATFGHFVLQKKKRILVLKDMWLSVKGALLQGIL